MATFICWRKSHQNGDDDDSDNDECENHDGDVMMNGGWSDRNIPQSLTDR